MNYPKLKLQHKNTKEIFHVVGILKDDNYFKYKLQSQSNLRSYRNIKIEVITSFYYKIGEYE